MAISKFVPTQGHLNQKGEPTRWTVVHDNGTSYVEKRYLKDEAKSETRSWQMIKVRGPWLKKEDWRQAVISLSSGKYWDDTPSFIEEPLASDYKVRDMVPFPDGTVRMVVKINGKKTFSRLSALLTEAESILDRVGSASAKGNPLLIHKTRQDLKEAYKILRYKAEVVLAEAESA